MKFAVKLLKRSDLTFFEPQYHLVNAGNQKSLNLNRRVLVDRFYPALHDLQHKAVIPVRLSIWGPDSAGELRIARSITKEAKNWRLNGEFVPNPDVEPNRFDDLAPLDVAVLRFDGTPGPEEVKLVVVSATAPTDAALHRTLLPLAGKSMRVVSKDALLAALEVAPEDHPARLLVWDSADAADLEDAAAGDPQATRRLSRRRVSREELAAARARAGDTGYAGEALIARWLRDRHDAGEIQDWNWIADQNAVNPFDFTLMLVDGTTVWVEAKTTTLTTARPFHISIAEIEAAAASERYDLYRVSGLDEAGGNLRIAGDVGDWARALLASLDGLPEGVRAQTLLVDEAQFEWSAPVALQFDGDDDDPEDAD